ncbi:hypothetical protein [Psychrobium sp. 1_MG-2023]|uniref:hypothetical protein n=1 Tax=Psychrobium sp. 1_MG-2023 TaxID=3062624 RepID=UPI000C33CD97|nr:hypothetical protein [Psychrobium sp. 1_MG-2023]MDP2562671.1 hypothetical protein [Psychrobium sp. 1_MG-2023]PKF53801.1 hypothetical protein CW748_17515 [Alteromonadales bacterium alter-6D02]
MNINAALYGQLVFLSMFIIGGLSYYLAKRKTSTPKMATLIGVLLCIVPPLNVVYLVVLMLKNDVVVKQSHETSL